MHGPMNGTDVVEKLNEDVQKNPNDPRPYNVRGRFWYDMGQYQRSIDDYSEAIRLQPDAGDTYLDRGVDEENLNRVDEALKDYDGPTACPPPFPGPTTTGPSSTGLWAGVRKRPRTWMRP